MISVCIATYNGAKYIREQIDSILLQLSDNDEIVVSDDGSTDATLEILLSYNDGRVKIEPNRCAKGVVGNFESALRRACGDYIFLCDQDDVWLPGKVDTCVNELQSCDLVMHDAIVWDGSKEIHESTIKIYNASISCINNIIKNSFIGCCLALRRSVLEYVLPIPNTIMHDAWIGIMVSKRGRVKILNRALILYRRHGENTSSTGERSKSSLTEKIRYRITLLYNTIKR